MVVTDCHPTIALWHLDTHKIGITICDAYFMSVEMRQGDRWVKVSDDHDWSTKIRWVKAKKSNALIAHLSWGTAEDTRLGQYRMKHTGLVTLSDGSTKALMTTSGTFTFR